MGRRFLDRLRLRSYGLQHDLRRRRGAVARCSGLLRLAHDEMPQPLFGDLQGRLELGAPAGVKREVLQDIGAFLLVLALVGELALAPEVGALAYPARSFDQRVDPLHRVLDLVVVQVSADDVENFVIPQWGPPSYGFRLRSIGGMCLRPKPERVGRYSTKGHGNQNKGTDARRRRQRR